MTVALKQNRIRPQLLAQKPVRITYKHFEDYHAPACVVMLDNGALEIRVYQKVARRLFEATPLFRVVPYQTFENGLVLHEVSHINAGTMDKTELLEHQKIYQQISNILDDSHDEYKFAYQYPAYSKYIQLVLSVLKYQNVAPEQSNLGIDLHTLYQMVRFGVVPDGSDERFVSFVLSMLQSFVRGSHENCVRASEAIYWYLYEKSNGQQAGGKEKAQWKKSDDTTGSGGISIPGVVAITQGDIDAMEEGTDLGTSGNKDALAKVVAEALQEKAAGRGEKTEVDQNGPHAGLTSEPLQLETGDEFYRNTVIKYADTIADLRRAFLQRMEYPEYGQSYDGDFNILQQEAAYTASFTYEDGPYYLSPKPAYPDLTVIDLTDVSGSTDHMQVEYAEAKVVFLAALEGIPGVFTGQIDFNSDAYVNKRLDDSLDACTLHPVAGGGTDLGDARRELDTWDLTRSKKLLFFVKTDGEISDWGNWSNEAQVWFDEKEQQVGAETWVIEVVVDGTNTTQVRNRTGYKNFFASTVSGLAEHMAEKVLARLEL